jgi:hypothetical protein
MLEHQNRPVLRGADMQRVRSTDFVRCRDSRDGCLFGSNTYRIIIPRPISSSSSWSLIAFDALTDSVLVTDQKFARVTSRSDSACSAAAISDGMTTVLCGPDRPCEAAVDNWIRTLPQRIWWMIIRFYGPPEEVVFGRWRPGEIHKVGYGSSD